MNKWGNLTIGLILLLGMITISWLSSAYNWSIFGKSLDLLSAGWIFLKGGIFWLVIMLGVLLIILGISDIKN